MHSVSKEPRGTGTICDVHRQMHKILRAINHYQPEILALCELCEKAYDMGARMDKKLRWYKEWHDQTLSAAKDTGLG